MMDIGYYPGCSQEGTAKEYDKSIRAILKVLDVNPVELDDWSCCGATSAHVTNHKLALALSARNLALAEKQNLKELFAPCAACFSRLALTQCELKSDSNLKTEIEDIIENKLNGTTEVINIIELFKKLGSDKIKANRKVELKGLKAACYYGCLLVRPHEINGYDDAEMPTSMEDIVKATGAETIEWNFKTECCGAAHSIPRVDIVIDLSKKILDDAKKHGANVIVVACPMCHNNLDLRQKLIKREYKSHEDIPVLYLSEFIGLSLGFSQKELGIDTHYIKFEMPELKKKESEVTV